MSTIAWERRTNVLKGGKVSRTWVLRAYGWEWLKETPSAGLQKRADWGLTANGWILGMGKWLRVKKPRSKA